MKIFLNGQPLECTSGLTIADLVQAHKWPAETILVECNANALRRKDWPNQKLSEGDRIEILQVAAGG